MIRRGFTLFAMIAILAAAGAVWFCAGLFGGMEYLGREGVFFQQAASDCGGAALMMIFNRYGIHAEYGQLLRRLQTSASGTAMLNMREVARAEGLVCEGWRLAARDLPSIPLPAVLLLRRDHFVVVDRIEPDHALVLDPARGRLRVSWRRLFSSWHGETLLFYKPGEVPARPGGWFVLPQFQERK
jgi:ABC-type bacteriocin/lantibiotic exporter with double-glycine peptidase domain